MAGIKISMKRFLREVDAIREVVNIYPRKRRQKNQRMQSILTKTSELQDKIMIILGLEKAKNTILG